MSDEKYVSDEALVAAVWERRVQAWSAADPLEAAYADLAAAGLATVGTDRQRLLWAKVETEFLDELEEDG